MDKMDAIDKIRIWLGIKTFIPSALKRQRNQMESMLRDGGWVHLDDKVEGKTIEEVLSECPDLSECQKGHSFRCPTGWSSSQCRIRKDRPATIRDLIGRK